MSLLSDGAAFRVSTRLAAYGQAVLYSRGSTLSAAITARPGMVERVIETDTSSVYTHDTDFVLAVADAVWSVGGSFIPQPGDKITYDSKVYEVVNQGNSQCYSESDHRGLSWRIHTKEVAS